ncbi:hypothetical protein MHBO_000008 [Bonamia ostreae]|uniref:Uncharacterized protein n=1 Tax=Bonamia ostreae TaxID=126728 RepID=A0ABV2AE39_9EUKA
MRALHDYLINNGDLKSISFVVFVDEIFNHPNRVQFPKLQPVASSHGIARLMSAGIAPESRKVDSLIDQDKLKLIEASKLESEIYKKSFCLKF